MRTENGDASKVKHFDRKKDFIIDNDDHDHMVVMKLFPTCRFSKEQLDKEDYRQFHCRFYLPKFKILNKRERITRVIIMINGLNETDFQLYDQFGRAMSQQGIASVLLPLPNHFNRHPWYRTNNNEKHINNFKPSDDFFSKPDDFFKYYSQGIDEIEILIDHLLINKNKNECPPDHESCKFFKYYFDPKVRVSILGYSLGGLGALVMFLAKPNLLNTCFSINSGVGLEGIKPGKVLSGNFDWETSVKTLQEVWENYTEKSSIKYYDIFERVFLGAYPSMLRNHIQKHADRILFIHGGADVTMPAEELYGLEPKKHGIAMFKVPGLDHFPTISKKWHRWFPIIAQLINQYEKMPFTGFWSRREIIDIMAKYHFKYNVLTNSGELNTANVESDEKAKIEDFYYRSRAFFPYTRTLYLEVQKREWRLYLKSIIQEQKGVTEDYALPVERKELAEKRFAIIALKDKLLKKSDISTVLDRMIERSKNGFSPKFGETAVDLELIKHGDIQSILKKQSEMKSIV